MAREYSPRYFGAAFLVMLAGLLLIVLGVIGQFGVALAVIIDPQDLQVTE